MAPTSWLTAPEITRGLVLTGEHPVYSQVYSPLQVAAGWEHNCSLRGKPRPVQARPLDGQRIAEHKHFSTLVRKNVFLPLPTHTLFGTEEMWTGTVFLLPSWTMDCTNKWSGRVTQRMRRAASDCLDGARILWFLTKRKEMCTQRHPLQFYL